MLLSIAQAAGGDERSRVATRQRRLPCMALRGPGQTSDRRLLQQAESRPMSRGAVGQLFSYTGSWGHADVGERDLCTMSVTLGQRYRSGRVARSLCAFCPRMVTFVSHEYRV